MRRSKQGHVAEPREPTQRASGAKMAWTCGRGPRESTQTPVMCHVAGGLAGEGPTG